MLLPSYIRIICSSPGLSGSTVIWCLFLLSSWLCSCGAQAQESLKDEGPEIRENSYSHEDVSKKLKAPIAPSPEKELPHTPADLPDSKKMPVIPLKASTKAPGIESSAQLMTGSPLSRYKGARLRFYRIRIKNGSEKPLLVLGSKMSLTPPQEAGGSPSVDAESLEKHDNTLLSGKKKAFLGIASAGTLGLAGPLLYEYMTPGDNRKRNYGVAHGRDAGRHEVESERIGTRLIMPGDDTEGWAAFVFKSDTTKVIYIPVMYPPYTKVSGLLHVPITGAIGKPEAEKPAKTISERAE